MLLRRLIIDASECSDAMRNSDALLQALLDGIEQCGATLRRSAVEPFNPHGITLALILGESHIVLSTWPEHRFTTIDAALCNPDLDIHRLVEPVLVLLAPQALKKSDRVTDTKALTSLA